MQRVSESGVPRPSQRLAKCLPCRMAVALVWIHTVARGSSFMNKRKHMYFTSASFLSWESLYEL